MEPRLMEALYTGKRTLESLHDATHYNRFLEDELAAFIAPHRAALDFGAGTGLFAKRLAARGIAITAIEQDPHLRAMIAEHGLDMLESLNASCAWDRIYSLNVLEHIEDDQTTIAAWHGALRPHGALFLYVPAFACLYSDFDRAIGHYRRYRRESLCTQLALAGFSVERAEYVDSLGFICWWWMARLTKGQKQLNPAAVRLFDRVVFPVSRLLDRVTRRWFGKNLLVIARKI